MPESQNKILSNFPFFAAVINGSLYAALDGVMGSQAAAVYQMSSLS